MICHGWRIVVCVIFFSSLLQTIANWLTDWLNQLLTLQMRWGELRFRGYTELYNQYTDREGTLYSLPVLLPPPLPLIVSHLLYKDLWSKVNSAHNTTHRDRHGFYFVPIRRDRIRSSLSGKKAPQKIVLHLPLLMTERFRSNQIRLSALLWSCISW